MGEQSRGDGAVLIPSSSRPPIEYQCLRSLGRRGIHTIYGMRSEDETGRWSRYCDETVPLPQSDDDIVAYRDRLLEISERPDVRTIVPTRESDAFVLSKFRDEFEAHVSLAVPSFESLRRVHDRILLAEAAEAAGVPVPETRSFDDVEDWDEDLIIKSRYNLLAHDYVSSCPPNETRTVKDVSYLRRGEVPDREEVVARMRHVPIVQESVSRKDEYMVGALCQRGEPLATIQLRQIREDSYVGGGGVYRKSTWIPELDRVARDLLAELDWHGIACIEYMEDAETGEFKLTEINPRVWQSIVPSVRAGVDFPYYYWLLATGRPELIDPTPKLGVGSHFVRGEINHLVSVFREDSEQVGRPNPYRRAGEIILSFVLDPRFDTFRLDDPQPFVRGILSGLQHRTASLRDEYPSLSRVTAPFRRG